MDYRSKNHSKFLLMYHIIFVVKYRRKLLNTYGEEVKNMFLSICNNYNFSILEIEVDSDHVHLLIESEPKISILQIVKTLKSISTRLLWGKHSNELRKYFWYKNIFWSRGYFVSTIGNASEEIIRKYIREQG